MFYQVCKEWSSLLHRTVLHEMYHQFWWSETKSISIFCLKTIQKGAKFVPYRIDIPLPTNNSKWIF